MYKICRAQSFLSEFCTLQIHIRTCLTKITTFFSAVMTMITGGSIGSGDTAVTVTGLTDTIVGSDLLVLGVIAVPLVGISVGLLSRLFRQRV